MAVSYFYCIQPLRVSSRGRLFFSNGEYCRDNHKRCCYLVSSSAQKSEKNLCLESKVEKMLENVKWDDKGLAVAIAQNVDTGAILMQGFVNKDALATTISSRKATFYSRSRSSLWMKG
ncbi:hypothetical protein L1049_001949 [Liquidambar formosana]|uniref:phosphoribosyl-AMP cyclohydrolase n=1 Tax=Liquidambar formosana TaxID=63359 RepID=A0AAP0R8K4_LIQFO